MDQTYQTALIVGGGRGAGRELAIALSGSGTQTHVVARTPGDLQSLAAETPGIRTISQDATDPAFATELMRKLNPDLLIITAGATPRMASPQMLSWAEFSTPWNVDVRIAHNFVSAALNIPMRKGGTVVSFSSGASLGGSRLSGGYAGAKRMQHFLTEYAQREADALGLDIRFLSVIPKQLVVGTEKGQAAAVAYAELSGTPLEKYWTQWDAPLTARDIAMNVHELLKHPDQWPAMSYLLTGRGMSELG